MSIAPVCAIFDDCFWASLEEGVRRHSPTWMQAWEELCEWGFQGQLKIFLPREQFLRIEAQSTRATQQNLWHFARRTLGAVYASAPTSVFRETQVVKRLSTFFCDEDDAPLPCELKPLSWLQQSELTRYVAEWNAESERFTSQFLHLELHRSRKDCIHAVVRDLIERLYGVDESKDVHAMVSLTLKDAGWRWTYAPSFAAYLEAIVQRGNASSFRERLFESEVASWLPLVDLLQVSDALHGSMRERCAHRHLTDRLVSSSDAASILESVRQRIGEKIAPDSRLSEPNLLAIAALK